MLCSAGRVSFWAWLSCTVACLWAQMLDGVNDSLANAVELRDLLAGLPCHVNLM